MAREMKDSGVEWIGEIPEDWEINTVFQLFTQVRNKNVDMREKNLLSLSYGKIKRKSINIVGGLLPESFNGYNIVEKNDIVLRLTDLQNDQKSLRVGYVEERGMVTSAYCTIRTRSVNNGKYLYYYLHSFDISKGFYGMGAGVRQGLNWDGLKWLKIIIPPFGEQKEIADFLDLRCAELDNVLDNTRASIEEYKKLKQAIITQAITKGVRGKREMKDSGIEWMGEIPKEWHMSKLKYLISSPLQYGASETGVDYIEELPRYIRITDITIDNKLKEDGKLSLEEATAMPYLLFDDDILFSRSGATVGKTFLYKAEYGRAAFAGYLIRASIDENKAVPKFVYYNTLSQNYDIWKNSMVTQATIQNIGAGKYSNYIIAMPLLEEQLEIVEYLDNKISEIDKIIQKKEQYLTEIENYKKSLIYEYVTGKKEVPKKY